MNGVKPKTHPVNTHPLLWHYLRTVFFSFVVFSLAGLYIYAQTGVYELRQLNRAFGDTGMILIGFSLILSSLAFFWDFADGYVSYRKDLGLIGFAYVSFHVVISLFGLPALFTFPAYYLAAANIIPFLCALISFIIYGLMASVSNQAAIRILGGKNWRYVLRAGFVAYIFSMLHYGLKSYPQWLDWFGVHNTILPPLSLWVTIFGSAVIIYRVILWMALVEKEAVPPSKTPIKTLA